MKIADFGCGEGKFQLALEKAGHKRENLFSFDAGKIDDHVTQCDISNVPLEKHSTDVVIFCLSLMGTNFPDFLREANRVLKPGGKLFIAEVLSRFVDIEKFNTKYMPKYEGFQLLKQSKLEDFFYIMVYKKVDDALMLLKPHHMMQEFAD